MWAYRQGPQLRPCDRLSWWGRLDSNQGRRSQRVYSPSPLATRAHPRDTKKDAPLCAFQVACLAKRQTDTTPRASTSVNDRQRCRAYPSCYPPDRRRSLAGARSDPGRACRTPRTQAARDVVRVSGIGSRRSSRLPGGLRRLTRRRLEARDDTTPLLRHARPAASGTYSSRGSNHSRSSSIGRMCSSSARTFSVGEEHLVGLAQTASRPRPPSDRARGSSSRGRPLRSASIHPGRASRVGHGLERVGLRI